MRKSSFSHLDSSKKSIGLLADSLFEEASAVVDAIIVALVVIIAIFVVAVVVVVVFIVVVVVCSRHIYHFIYQDKIRNFSCITNAPSKQQ